MLLNLPQETYSILSLTDCRSNDITELPFDESGIMVCVFAESATDSVSGKGCFVYVENALSDNSIDFL